MQRYPSKITRLASQLQSRLKLPSGAKRKAKWQPDTSLGRYLWLAAKMFIAMEDVAEENLIRNYVLSDPPLGIRRTLNQYYYHTTETLGTDHRHKDQVVYRATQAILDNERQRSSPTGQVVMVDQLWMWILDRSKYREVHQEWSPGHQQCQLLTTLSDTVLACFPKRWGSSRHGASPSDIHVAICERLAKLDTAADDWTAHDLAIVVVEECSKVLLDRFRAVDEGPDLLAIFKTATAELVRTRTIECRVGFFFVR